MKSKYKRLTYLLMTLIVIFLGLLSRKMTDYIPDILDIFWGDMLWALMVYLLLRVTFKNWSIKKIAITGILFCYIIEASQLYHSYWIDTIRNTTLGGLILGYGFLWSDLVSYLLGILLGIIVDIISDKKSKI